MTFEEFKSFYESKGFCPNDLVKSKRKNALNDRQLESRFRDYEKGQVKKKEAVKKHSKTSSKKVIEKDLEWEKVREEVFQRDHHLCQLVKILPYCDLKLLQQNAGGFIKVLDPAHIF